MSGAAIASEIEGCPRPPRLAVRGLAVDRGTRRVLDGLEFEVHAGEIFGLLGPNGAGKTSAFHVLTGLLPAAAGDLRLDGVSIAPGDRRLREVLGVVFQEPALDPRLTPKENLRLAARLHGVPREAVQERTTELLAWAGLAERAADPVRTLSGGMRRRVELARALIHRPTILILDEPTTGLDEASFRATWDRLRDLRGRTEMAMILTTHRPDEAEFCDRLGIVDHGRLVACDTPDRLRDRVRGDLLVLEAAAPEEVADALRRELALEPRLLDGRVVLERDRAHEWIPRIVESLPDGALQSVSLRRTGLGEVFLELTGHELTSEHVDGEVS
jgi:ABC-2 type transport system ATP-binding protein